MDIQYASPIVSAISLIVSLITAWFTILRRGTVCSTHPSLVAFRYDFVGKDVPQAKIYLRTLLFSTAKRGHVIECLCLRVREGGRYEEFSFWGHGEKDNLTRGSGMFVSETGVLTDHHFNPLRSDALFRFSQGTYTLELVVKFFNRADLIALWRIDLEMPAGPFGSSIDPHIAVYFNWSVDQGRYVASVESRSPK